jgi:glutathione S-transferase
MKLYTGDLSPYSAKVRIQIYAMGIKDDVEFDLPLASFYQGKFKNTSPIGRIPVLEVEEGIIPESEVITEYLDERYPEQSLMRGKSLKERADIRVISRIADTYLMNNIFLALSQLDPAKRNEGVVDLLMAQVERGMTALEQHISDEGFATGDTLTRADASLVPALFMCQYTVPRFGKPNPIEATVKVKRYWAHILQNEHCKRGMDEMMLGLKARMDGSEQKLVQQAIAKAT